MNYLPSKLTKLRKHYNYSQSYIADILSIETTQYMNYENGSEMINYDQMKKLADLYDISLVEIFKNSDEVTLHEIDNSTDEINIEYFKDNTTILDKIKDFYNQNKLTSTIIVVLLITILIMSIILQNTTKPYTLIRDNINRLSVSETTVVYIDDYSGVNGSGSNLNGELSNLTSSAAIKVCEGEGFTIILNEDGTLSSSGLIDKYAQEISDWRNIVDVAAGSAHVVGVDSNGRVKCAGDNSAGACDIENSRNIAKVYATSKGTILMDESGELSYCGSFIGSGSLKNYRNIKDIASSENILVVLCEDNTLDVFSKNSDNYFVAESWADIVDVACGDSYVAGLDKYGKVHIEIDNTQIEEEIKNWSNIIAIDGASDYLIGFDGIKIYGVGNNNYGQFVKQVLNKTRLEKVSDVEYNIDKQYVNVQFKGVSNASGYIVSIDVGIGISRRVESDEIVKFETDNMTDGKMYTVSIISVGEGDYIDSDEYKFTFVYNTPEDTYTFLLDNTSTPEQFEEYLLSFGVDQDKISSKQDESVVCEKDEVTVIDSNLFGKTLTTSELLNTDIEYTYCRLDDEE